MFKVNEYFDGKVKSLSFNTATGHATVGVMAPGEFEFGTSTKEYMTIVSGEMQVMLPGEGSWNNYKPFETFIVPAGVRFLVKMNTETAYLCRYE
ncbi:MAG TPA: pyrimidine/purine nucleoside phosphorylase [Bacteroidales bacterium]|nr:pyrimidine/purine nucleoside phosphorylase [Bacteroidales bacterium]